MNFENYIVPVIVVICLAVGFVVKKWVKDIDNKYIPTICGLLGIVLAVWVDNWVITPNAVGIGLVSGLASTGIHQAFMQFIENKSEE